MKFKISILFLITICVGCTQTLKLEENSSSQNSIVSKQPRVTVQCRVEKVKLPMVISPSFNSEAVAILKPETEIPMSKATRIEYHYEVYTSNGSDLIPDIKEYSNLTLVFTPEGELIGRE